MFQFKIKSLIGLTSLLTSLCFIQTGSAEEMASATKNYAHFNATGKLIRPVGHREWIYIGSPLTPNDMNNGKAAFPEFHNVYIDPTSWKYWKKTGKFRDGTLIVKELVSVGSKQAASGKGYFQGEYIGLEAMTKSKQKFPDSPGNWGYFRFTIDNSSELRKVSSKQADKNCLACHQAQAAQDQVFTQYYPVLRAGKSGVDGK